MQSITKNENKEWVKYGYNFSCVIILKQEINKHKKIRLKKYSVNIDFFICYGQVIFKILL